MTNANKELPVVASSRAALGSQTPVEDYSRERKRQKMRQTLGADLVAGIAPHSTGSESGPRNDTFGANSSVTPVTSRKSGSRADTSSSTTFPCKRASGAPRQRCGPAPKERCSREFGRLMSRRSGSGKTDESRFAAPRRSSNLAPE